MRIKILTIILSIFFVSCNKIQLIKSDIKYSELPKEVKKHIFENEFIDLNDPKKYKKELHNTLFPWIFETRIVRLVDNQSYKIDFEKEYNSATLIITDDFLYTTNNYNLYESDSLYYTFSKYLLK